MKNPPLLTEEYVAAPNQQVLLTLIIGNAQLGASAVWIDEVFHSKKLVYTREALGPGSTLAGHEIRVKTIVTDINSFSNKMSVTYTLEGGPAPLSRTALWEVESDGDSAVFKAIFTIKL